MATMLDAAIVFAVGLGLFLIVGQCIDAVVYRIAVGPDDSITKIIATAPNPRRRFFLNILRPIISSVIIFGGGLLTIAYLGLGTWGAIGAGTWFFILTQVACLAGRRASLNEAGWAMVITIIVLLGAFVTIQNIR